MIKVVLYDIYIQHFRFWIQYLMLQLTNVSRLLIWYYSDHNLEICVFKLFYFKELPLQKMDFALFRYPSPLPK